MTTVTHPITGTPEGLEFEPGGHVYTLDGNVVPSVTQVIAPIVDYSMVPDWQLQWAAERGTAAHRACELWDRGELEFSTLDERLQPYLDGWIRFRLDAAPEFTAIEQRLAHRGLRYAGTCDRVALINGVRALVEIKTTATLLPATAVQLAGYELAYNFTVPEPERARARYAVHLKPDGTYSMLRYSERADFDEFRALLTHYYWSARYLP